MRGLDFTSWQSLLATLASLALVALVGVGIRLIAMTAIQQRRERANRQINERLRTLIAAYKTLGGSFTGDLAVDPRHLRDVRPDVAVPLDLSHGAVASSDRTRRIRDAVEAALSDIILLGTDAQVRLASHAAAELIEGRPVHTHQLVVSLRDFVREALDLDPIPVGLTIPRQGPARPGASAGKGKDGDREGKGQGGGGGGAGMGMGMGGGAALGLAHEEVQHGS
jgi:type II secretory pathway pseudopilin PulG